MGVAFRYEPGAGPSRRERQIAQRERIAEKLSRGPIVDVFCVDTTPARPRRANGAEVRPRTGAKNAKIYYVWRRPKKLALGQRDIKEIIKATAKELQAAKTEPGGLAIWAKNVGELLVKAVRDKIRAAHLIDTGQLIASIATRAKNI